MGVARNAFDIVYLGYVGSVGGDTLQLFQLAAGMAARGLRVKVIVPAVPNTKSFADRFAGENVVVERTPLIRFGLVQNPVNVLRLVNGASRAAPVLHVHTGDIAVPRLTLLAMDALRLPRAFATIHHPYPEDMAVGSPRARFWANAANRRFQAVISPSRHGRNAQVAYGVSLGRARVIHNSVPVEQYAAGSGAAARASLGLAPDAPLVVFTSRLHKQKRPLDALAAFARIAPEFPAAHLVFVGSGPLEEETKAAAAATGLGARVRFTGFVANVPDWLAASDVWLLPTEAENFSLAVLEALAAGCAIASTLCRGNDEVLVEGKNALAAPIGDVDAFAGVLRRLLGDPALRARLRAGARETARNYTIARMVDEHLACYRAAGGMPGG